MIDALEAMSGWSSLFPLPQLAPLPPYRGRSGRIRQRKIRQRRIGKLYDRIALSLNALNKGMVGRQTMLGRAPPGEGEATAARQSVLWYLLGEAASFDRARRGLGLSGDRAVEALTKQTFHGTYTRARTMTPHVSFRANLVAEPKDDFKVDMLAAMPPEDRDYYNSEDNVVDPCGVPPCLLKELESRFSFVGGSYNEYVKYFFRPDLPRGLWSFRPLSEAHAIAGFSAVREKDGVHQRKLLMAVVTNAQWSDPRSRRGLGLFGGGALASLHVTGDSWSLSAFGADNAFTRIETLAWVWPWLAVPPLMAADIWSLLDPELQASIPHNTLVAPQYTRLAMGLSHSVLILMSIGMYQSGLAMESGRRLTERHLTPSFGDPLELWLTRLRRARAQPHRVFVAAMLFLGDLAVDVGGELNSFADGAGMDLLLLDVDFRAGSQWQPHRVEVANELAQEMEGGEVDVLLACPPCRRSQLHHRGEGDAFWRPRVGLTVEEEQAFGDDNEIMLNLLHLCEAVHDCGGSVAVVDSAGAALPQLSTTEEFKGVSDRCGFVHVAFGGGLCWGTLDGLAAAAECGDFLDDPAGTCRQEKPTPFERNGSVSAAAQTVLMPGCSRARLLSSCAIDTLARFRRDDAGPGGARRGPRAQPKVMRWSRLGTHGSEPHLAFMNELAERRRAVVLHGSQLFFYFHVDDGIVGGATNSPAAPDSVMNRIADTWEAVGFVVKDRRIGAEVDRVVGYTPISSPARLCLPPDKAGLLHESLKQVLSWSLVPMPVLATITGVWVWGALLRRPLLSIPYYLFQQLDRDEGLTRPLWPSVRREVQSMMDLIPMMFADVGMPLSPLLFASDARGGAGSDCGGSALSTRLPARRSFTTCSKMALSSHTPFHESTGTCRA